MRRAIGNQPQETTRRLAVLLVLRLLAGCGGDGPATAGLDGRGPEDPLQGIVRFLPENGSPAAFPPSLALVDPFPGIDRVPDGWTLFPAFSQGDGEYRARLPVEPGTSLYGTGEIAGPLLRDNAVTQTWNYDSALYCDRNDHLYQSHPWVLAVRADGTAFGVLADTTVRTRIDLRGGISFSTEAQPFPVIVIDAASPQQVLEGLARLTGTPPLPPLWSLGYHQCRFSYTPDSKVRAIADGFRSRRIPCDVIWLDIDYMDGYRIFTFDPVRFPDPAATNAYLHRHGFHAVWMIDPGVKKEPGYFVYDQGTAGDHWVRDAQGAQYTASVWPGPCAFPDFTRPETRGWWAGLHRGFMALGIDGVWNDMNEPAIFPPLGIVGSKTMPEDNLHRGGGGLPPAAHALYHNVYGMLMVQATREGVLAANPDRRPFVLTRSNFIGGHRYAATWTGDNLATWNHLRWSVSMVLNLGLSGQPFSGPDIGGHIPNTPPDLFARWIGTGAFFPFCRGHKTKGMLPHEPWSFGPEVETVARTALERRYRLLPYLYTLFHEAATTGLPVVRPVFFADPADPALRAEDHAFLLGPHLLVEPQLTEEGGHVFAEPAGIWLPFTLAGEDPAREPSHPVLKIRGGAIVPLGRVVQNTAEPALEPLTLLVALDETGRAEGTLYEDAGDGFAFRAGDCLLTTYEARAEGDQVLVRVKGRRGGREPPRRATRVEWITGSGVISAEGDAEEGIRLPRP